MPVLLLIVLNICVVRGIANLNRTLPSQSLPNNGKCLDFPGVFDREIAQALAVLQVAVIVLVILY